ncbi:indolepyruvate oxidoreductase subunit beta [Thermogladius sp. 4427co]|uniref:indolepyruvate oxidoreductase subunit beta n=1 Tax=Thermogladius sp. 4427co TaxID=3450718 RepID=UPI003F7AF144
MKPFNILLVGVGGQGLLTLGSLIAWASAEAGIKATVAETHGLSQRGGTLSVHVRLNNEYSSLIPPGETDLLIGLELLETLRYIYYANPDTVVLSSRFRLPPPLTNPPSIIEVEEALTKTLNKVYIVDADQEAKRITGSSLFSNTLLLGIALGIDNRLRSILGLESLEKAVEVLFRGRVRELNLRALKYGYEKGLELARRGNRRDN